MELTDTLIAREALAVFLRNIGMYPDARRKAPENSPQNISPLLRKLSDAALKLIVDLDKRAEKLRRQLSKELEVFEAIFVERIYEEQCPQECLLTFRKLSKELKWESKVLSSYTTVAEVVKSLGKENAFINTLRNSMTLARNKHKKAFENLSFLCPRLLMLTQDIFDALFVITTEELVCEA